MKKLNNAPLIYVEYKIWWHLYTPKDYQKSEYIVGDYFSLIRDNYPIREIGNSEESNFFLKENNTTSFLRKENDDESYKISLSKKSLTLLTENKSYEWDNFEEEVDTVSKPLLKTVNNLLSCDHYHLALQYFNFIEFDSKEHKVLDFLNGNFNLSIAQKIYSEETNSLFLVFTYKFDDDSDITIEIGTGEYDNKKGLIVKQTADSGKVQPDYPNFKKWNIMAHEVCSNNFHSMFTPEFYKSFS